MHTRLFQRFAQLPGSARRYYDRQTGHSILRRSFPALQGIRPERRAFLQRASGLIPQRKPRCDAGKRRVLDWAQARRVPLGNHQAVIVPFAAASPRLVARCFQVVIDHLAVVHAYLLPRLGKRRGRWCCGACQLIVRNKLVLLHHVLYEHFSAVCPQSGSTMRFGYVPSRERRARMPWRLSAPELQL